MGNPTPTKIHFFQACYFCLLAIFCPSKLEVEEKKDNEQRAQLPKTDNSSARIINYAFWSSFLLILLFSMIGALAGYTLSCALGVPSRGVISFLQILGASLLLWGTLFIRGFEIVTFDTVSLTERVNQWLYRAMYCFGTSLIIMSLVW
ncbi:MAG: hypothetical protein M0036_01825 [Desulfobacteraceae bacterium]|nr:hypothetical protein [Desulfobacteraceae bacterium]